MCEINRMSLISRLTNRRSTRSRCLSLSLLLVLPEYFPKLSSLLFSDGEISQRFSSWALLLNRLPAGRKAEDSDDDEDDDNEELEVVDDVNKPVLVPFNRGRNAAA